MSAQIIRFPGAPEPWVTGRQVLEYFNVSQSTLDRWTKAGMPCERIGGVRRFRLSECEEWHKGAA